jgi:hypothetical protein
LAVLKGKARDMGGDSDPAMDDGTGRTILCRLP